jgi:hypothetical protein
MERTYLDELYDYFLSSLSDYKLLQSIQTDPTGVKEDLLTYYKKAKPKFYKCKNNLDLLEDEIGHYFGVKKTVKEKYDSDTVENKTELINKYDVLESDISYQNGLYTIENAIIPNSLTEFEMAILTHLMLVEYMKPQVLSTEVIKQSLSDKDFKIYSQANQLRELNLLYRLLQKESKKLITEYTYMEMGQ